MTDFHIFDRIPVDSYPSEFYTEEACLEHIAGVKWEHGYQCRKCGHDHYCRGKTPYSRRCTKCKHEESATAHTIFHRCKIALPTAFRIAWLVCHQPDVSSYHLSEELNIRQMTCWKFKKKVIDCLSSRDDLSPDIRHQLESIAGTSLL
ncbi:MAG: transposase [Bacteroidales bacterium]|nr:transposase [Bacteroidales bacterium]MDD3664368.1 transposase [Bacteroidales bacterium]